MSTRKAQGVAGDAEASPIWAGEVEVVQAPDRRSGDARSIRVARFHSIGCAVSSKQVIRPTNQASDDSVTSRYGQVNFTEISCVRQFVDAFYGLPFIAGGNLKRPQRSIVVILEQVTVPNLFL